MRGKFDLKRTLLFGIPLLLLAVGAKILDNEGRFLWFERNGTDYSRASFYLFTGEKHRSFDVDRGERVYLTWKAESEEGSLELVVQLPDDESVLRYSDSQEIEYHFDKKGRVRLTVIGNEARKGKFEVSWEVSSAKR